MSREKPPAQPAQICRKSTESGTVYLRDGVTVAFFLPMPFASVVPQVAAAFDEYLKLIPPDALRWSAVGANSQEWKPVGRTTLNKCRELLKPAAAKKRSLTSFELQDGESGGDAPSRGIIVIGNPPDSELPDERNLVQMCFPRDAVAAGHADEFVADISNIAALLPFCSGYASPGLHWAELESGLAMMEARAIAKRHPGYDVQDNARERSEIDDRVRGARWLTFLGPTVLTNLGGLKAIRRALPPEIAIDEVGAGVMLRAGKVPEIGDAVRKQDTPLLRALARVLEPVTYFNGGALIGREFGTEDDDFLQRWERRFLE